MQSEFNIHCYIKILTVKKFQERNRYRKWRGTEAWFTTNYVKEKLTIRVSARARAPRSFDRLTR